MYLLYLNKAEKNPSYIKSINKNMYHIRKVRRCLVRRPVGWNTAEMHTAQQGEVLDFSRA